MIMVLKEGINNTSHELSDITFNLTVLFPSKLRFTCIGSWLEYFLIKNRNARKESLQRKKKEHSND